jgi:hypothetical protein
VNVAFDHVVVVVPRLAPAERDLTAAGFIVTPGGRHDVLPTENALVVFADGGYLELIALRDADARASLERRSGRPGWAAELRRGPAVARRFLPRLLGPPGVADWVVRTSHLARDAAELRRRGHAATGPVPMGRARPDGTRLEWQLVLPAADRLPFLIEDRTPRVLRVPDAPETHGHPNGASGVAGVRVRVAEVAGAALEFADLLGVRLHAGADGSTRFELGGLSVTLEAGEPEGARAASLRGVASLPPALEALGIGAGGA